MKKLLEREVLVVFVEVFLELEDVIGNRSSGVRRLRSSRGCGGGGGVVELALEGVLVLRLSGELGQLARLEERLLELAAHGLEHLVAADLLASLLFARLHGRYVVRIAVVGDERGRARQAVVHRQSVKIERSTAAAARATAAA